MTSCRVAPPTTAHALVVKTSALVYINVTLVTHVIFVETTERAFTMQETVYCPAGLLVFYIWISYKVFLQVCICVKWLTYMSTSNM